VSRAVATERGHDLLARALQYEIRETRERLPPEEHTSIEIVWMESRLALLHC
jgi:hypothetical protein